MDSNQNYNLLLLHNISSISYSYSLQLWCFMSEYFTEKNDDNAERVEILLDELIEKLEFLTELLKYLSNPRNRQLIIPKRVSLQRFDSYKSQAIETGIYTNEHDWDKIVNDVRGEKLDIIFMHLIGLCSNIQSTLLQISNRYNSVITAEEHIISNNLLQINERWTEFVSYVKALYIISEYIEQDVKNNIYIEKSSAEVASSNKSTREKPVFYVVK